MFSLVFSLQWNIALSSFIMGTYYVSEMENNFQPTTPYPLKKNLAFHKTPDWGCAMLQDHLMSDKIKSDSFIKK